MRISKEEFIRKLRERAVELEVEKVFRRPSPRPSVANGTRRRGRPPKPDRLSLLYEEDEDDLYQIAQDDYE